MQKPSVATHRRGQNCAHYAIELSKELTNRRSPITTVDVCTGSRNLALARHVPGGRLVQNCHPGVS